MNYLHFIICFLSGPVLQIRHHPASQKKAMRMSPPVKPFRTDITAEHLRMKAAMVQKPSEIDKWSTLADLYARIVRLEDLKGERRTKAVRWLKELHDFDGSHEDLLKARKSGPPVPIPSDRSATEFRTLAEGAGGVYRRRLLGLCTLVETRSLPEAAKVAEVEPEQFLKVLSRYRNYGLRGLSAETSHIEPERVAEVLEAGRRPPSEEHRNMFEALAALSVDGATFREVAARFGIPEGTFADNVARFNLGGVPEFEPRAVKIARGLKNEEHAALLRRAAVDYAHDLDTANRCLALADHFDGVLPAAIKDKNKFDQQPLAKIRRRYESEGLFSVIGDTAFLRRGADYARELERISRHDIGKEIAPLLLGAAMYHRGLRLADCAKKASVEKLDLKRLLDRIRVVDISDLSNSLAAG